MGTVSPSQFSVTIMLYVLVWVLVGGVNTFWSPIIGVLVLYLVQENLRGVLLQWMPMFYGIILISIMFALPDGLESMFNK